jgi:predicted amidohydrolase YtcJ
MDRAAPSAEALAVRDGRILAVGAEAAVLATRGPHTELVDLGGKTLLPGFLDGHSHFINALSVASQANVYAPPFGPGDSIAGIVGALEALRVERDFGPGKLLMAYGYDENALPRDHPLTAADLDAHFPDRPVIVGHVSLHGAVLNSVALEQYGITAETETPPGGIIARKPGTSEPSGLLMETAFLPIFASLPKPSPDEVMAALDQAQAVYAAAGVTTAHDGATHMADLAILERGAREGRLFLDVIAYPFITEMDEVLREHPASSFGKYEGRLKLGGIKITCDGSVQGKTAYFTSPYLTGGPTGQENWRGEPTFPVETLQGMMKKVYDTGLPLIIHANGDAAIDIVLSGHELALGEHKAGDHRTGIIHCQFVRKDQLERIAEWKLIPSFFSVHTYFFAGAHVTNRGREQAEFLSPLKSARSLGIRFANHTDFNVTPIDHMFVLWSAVNRVSREGEVIGPAERVTPLEALEALTIDAAWWYREEGQKGSLEPGKLADLVILDRNPLTVEPMTIKDIRVVETIKEGRTIWRAE